MLEAHKKCNTCMFEAKCKGRRRERATRIGYCRFHIMEQVVPEKKKKKSIFEES